MGILEKISGRMEQFGSTVASAARIMLMSHMHGCKVPRCAESGEIVVLGNGPSLSLTMDSLPGFLSRRDLLAVNFSLNSSLIVALKPRYYVLADPHFFSAGEQDNVKQLWANINAVDWKMTLFVPANTKRTNFINNSNIEIVRYHLTPVEGWKAMAHYAFKHNLGMPRPRNVLVPSIMLAIAMGYKKIYIAGADHTWLQNLWVQDDNQVVTKLPHFYKEDDKEIERVKVVYLGCPLYKLLESYAVAFKSYHEIRKYVETLNDVKILNITPGSFIDAFERCSPNNED